MISKRRKNQISFRVKQSHRYCSISTYIFWIKFTFRKKEYSRNGRKCGRKGGGDLILRLVPGERRLCSQLLLTPATLRILLYLPVCQRSFYPSPSLLCPFLASKTTTAEAKLIVFILLNHFPEVLLSIFLPKGLDTSMSLDLWR